MKQRILLLAAFLFSLTNNAQVKTDAQATPTPSRIKVYSPNSFQSKSADKKDNSYKYAVKTDPIAMITGEFPLIAEYRFSTKFSIEGSAAITYGFIPNDGFLGNDNSSLFDDDSKAAIGNAFRGTLKFYPSSDYDAIEGWYVGIQLFTKTTNRTYQDTTYSDSSSNTKYTDSKTKNGVSLIVGKQVFVDSNVMFETFAGIGLANIDREQPTYDYNTSTVETVKSNESQPNFQFGVRIGFGN